MKSIEDIKKCIQKHPLTCLYMGLLLITMISYILYIDAYNRIKQSFDNIMPILILAILFFINYHDESGD